MAILRSKEIWEMEIEDIEEKLVELKAELAKNVSKSRTQKDYCSCSYNYEPKTEGELNVKNL